MFTSDNIINVKAHFAIKYNEIIVKWSRFPLLFSNWSEYENQIDEKLLVVALIEAKENLQNDHCIPFLVESIVIDLEVAPEYQLSRIYGRESSMHMNKIESLEFTPEMYQPLKDKVI